MGSGGNSSGAVRAVESGAAVPAAREEQGGGVWEHADQWDIHPRPHHHLLRSDNHFPHRHWSPHLYRLIPIHIRTRISFFTSICARRLILSAKCGVYAVVASDILVVYLVLLFLVFVVFWTLASVNFLMGIMLVRRCIV